ncbi:MAG TPA: hypothetical protein VLG71_02925 [Candidatus Limnocylindria bacterium]|nr:hypothetical protein [Candidatus Limnocylindria bacterium]
MKTILTMFSAFLFPFSLYSTPPKTHPQQQTSWTTKYRNSIAIGTLIGTTTGGLCGLIDASTNCVLIPLTWYVSRSIRKTATKSIEETLSEENIRYCKYVIHDTAWLASWISWWLMIRII